MSARLRGVLATLAVMVLAWLAWDQSPHLAEWVGLGDVDILVQLAAVLVVLGLAEMVLARLPHRA